MSKPPIPKQSMITKSKLTHSLETRRWLKGSQPLRRNALCAVVILPKCSNARSVKLRFAQMTRDIIPGLTGAESKCARIVLGRSILMNSRQQTRNLISELFLKVVCTTRSCDGRGNGSMSEKREVKPVRSEPEHRSKSMRRGP